MEQTTLYIIVIVLLVSLLILSILGTGFIVNIVNWILDVMNILLKFILHFLGSLSRNTGEIVNGTGDVVTDTSIFGIEIVDGIIHDIGNMFKGQATPISSNTNHLDIIIQTKGNNNNHVDPPAPSSVTSTPTKGSTPPKVEPTPEPANNNKENEKWCFIGRNDDGSNTCVKLQPNQRCDSKKVYNSGDECKKNN